MTRGAHPRASSRERPRQEAPPPGTPTARTVQPGTPTHAPEPPAGPPDQPDLELVTSPHHRRSGSVLPTHVGVVRRRWRRRRWRRGAPHARGGGSTDPVLCAAPSSAPHARGGGSDVLNRRAKKSMCSPRTRGWFGHDEARGVVVLVFPTHVGVVRTDPAAATSSCRAPHARGGGSFRPVMRTVTASCSPRTWGWFGHGLGRRLARVVLPTHVGVVRAWPGTRRRGACAPHARGVVPRGGPRRWP